MLEHGTKNYGKIKIQNLKFLEMSNNKETFITKATCSTSYNNKVYLVDYQRYVLVALVALMILNLFANSAVLIVLSVSKFC